MWMTRWAYGLQKVVTFANTNGLKPGELVVSSGEGQAVRKGCTYYVVFAFFLSQGQPIIEVPGVVE